jgi:hypothetical protein
VSIAQDRRQAETRDGVFDGIASSANPEISPYRQASKLKRITYVTSKYKKYRKKRQSLTVFWLTVKMGWRTRETAPEGAARADRPCTQEDETKGENL